MMSKILNKGVRAIILLAFFVLSAHCGGAVVRQSAPPEQRVEQPGPRPDVNSVWVQGHWEFENGHYLWSAGRWVQARRIAELTRKSVSHSWLFHVNPREGTVLDDEDCRLGGIAR